MEFSVAERLEIPFMKETNYLCFHPTKPLLAISVSNQILIYNVINGTTHGRLIAEEGGQVTHIAFVNSPSISKDSFYIAAFTDEGELYVWDELTWGLVGGTTMGVNTGTLRKVTPTPGANGIQTCTSSTIQPFLFCSKPNGKDVFAIEINLNPAPNAATSGTPLTPASRVNLFVSRVDIKKTVSCMECHPSKPYLAVGCTDGSIKILDYTNNKTLVSFDDLTKFGSTSINSLSWYSGDSFYLLASTLGVLGVWGSTANAVQTMTCIGSIQSEIVSATFHPIFEYITEGKQSSQKDPQEASSSKEKDRRSILALKTKKVRKGGSTPSSSTNSSAEPEFEHDNAHLSGKALSEKHPLFVTISTTGDVLAWSVHSQGGQTTKVIRPCGLIKPFSVLKLELSNRFNHLPDYYYSMHLHHKNNHSANHGIDLKPLGLLFHSKYNLCTFNFLNKGPIRKHASSGIAQSMYREQLVYAISDLHTAYPEALLPFVNPLFDLKAPSKNLYFNPQFSVPDFVYFLQDNAIIRYNVIQHQREVILVLGEIHEQYDCRAIKFLQHAEKSDEKSRGRFVVLFHGVPYANPNDKETSLMKIYGGTPSSFSTASDICHWGEDYWISLSPEGNSLSIHKWTSSKSGSITLPKFPAVSFISKIFPVTTNTDSSLGGSEKKQLDRLLCYDRINHRLHCIVFSATESTKSEGKDRKEKVKTKVKYSAQLEGHYLQLYPDEVPLEVVGHCLENYSGLSSYEFVVGIITTKRALIVDLNLQILSHSTGLFHTASNSQTQSLTFLKSPYSHIPPYKECSEHQYNLFSSLINSCCWIGDSFVYNTAATSQIRYLTVSHSAQSDSSQNIWVGDHFLQSLDSPFAVIIGVLPDRIIYVSRLANQLVIKFAPINLVEPLILGYIDSFVKNQPVSDVSLLETCHHSLNQILKKVVARYDCCRVSQKLIERLMALTSNSAPEYKESHPYQYYDLCYALLNGVGVYDFIVNPQVSWMLKLDIALSQKKFSDALEIVLAQRKTERTMEEETAIYLRKLANNARDNGQYEIARQCYEALEDNMEILFIATINKNYVLIQNLRERAINNNNLLLQAACERQLEIQHQLKIHPSADSTENPLVLKNWSLSQQLPFLPSRSLELNQWNTADKCSVQLKVEQSAVGANPPKVEVTKNIDVNDIRMWFSQPIDQLLDNESDPDGKGNSNASPRPEPSSPMSSKSPERRTSRSRQKTIHRSLNLASIGSSESASVEILEKPKEVLPSEIIPILPTKNPNVVRYFSTSASTLRTPCYKRPTTVNEPTNSNAQTEKREEKTMEDKFLASPIWGRIAVPTNAGSVSPAVKETASGKTKFHKTSSGSLSKLQQSASADATSSSFQSRFNAQPTTHRATPLDYLKKAINNLEKGLFMEAMIELDNGIELLVSVADPYVNQQDVKLCIFYKIALDLLLELKRIDKDSQVNQRVTQLASLLAAIPLQNKHRTVCLRLAINKNFSAENFGIASKLVEQLFGISSESQSLPDKAAMDEKLNKCKENKFTDAASTTIQCRGCNNQVSVASNQCSCGQKVLFCYQTLEIINEIPWLKCAFCDATYSYKSMKLGNRCSFCNFGNLTQQSSSQ